MKGKGTPRKPAARRDFMGGYRHYEGDERGSPDDWRDAFAERLGLEAARATLKEESPWEVLGLLRGAEWAAIRAAYRRLVMETHPDRGGTAEAFRRVQAAYEVLEDQVPH